MASVTQYIFTIYRKTIYGRTNHKGKYRTRDQSLSFIMKTDSLVLKLYSKGLDSLFGKVFSDGTNSPNMVTDCLKKLFKWINIARLRVSENPSSGKISLIRQQIL